MLIRLLQEGGRREERQIRTSSMVDAFLTWGGGMLRCGRGQELTVAPRLAASLPPGLSGRATDQVSQACMAGGNGDWQLDPSLLVHQPEADVRGAGGMERVLLGVDLRHLLCERRRRALGACCSRCARNVT
eukprot:759305-Hanusia_phi.AAC.1